MEYLHCPYPARSAVEGPPNPSADPYLGLPSGWNRFLFRIDRSPSQSRYVSRPIRTPLAGPHRICPSLRANFGPQFLPPRGQKSYKNSRCCLRLPGVRRSRRGSRSVLLSTGRFGVRSQRPSARETTHRHSRIRVYCRRQQIAERANGRGRRSDVAPEASVAIEQRILKHQVCGFSEKFAWRCAMLGQCRISQNGFDLRRGLSWTPPRVPAMNPRNLPHHPLSGGRFLGSHQGSFQAEQYDPLALQSLLHVA